MTAHVDALLGPLDTAALAGELDQLQQRLDLLARSGANPYAVARLRRALHAARRDLAVLAADEPVAPPAFYKANRTNCAALLEGPNHVAAE